MVVGRAFGARDLALDGADRSLNFRRLALDVGQRLRRLVKASAGRCTSRAPLRRTRTRASCTHRPPGFELARSCCCAYRRRRLARRWLDRVGRWSLPCPAAWMPGAGVTGACRLFDPLNEGCRRGLHGLGICLHPFARGCRVRNEVIVEARGFRAAQRGMGSFRGLKPRGKCREFTLELRGVRIVENALPELQTAGPHEGAGGRSSTSRMKLPRCRARPS